MSLQVVITKGLPASGKTTWAKEWLKKAPGQWKRINKDDLRAMLDDGKWNGANEKFIIKTRDMLILLALAEGKNVIVDDTNLTPKHEQHITALVKDKATVKVKEFNVDLDECIRRDKQRQKSVGAKVIRSMYNRYLRVVPERQVMNNNLPNTIICDLDGTLALFGDKSPYDRDYSQDDVNHNIKNIVEKYPVIYVSGRERKHFETTTQWLLTNGLPEGQLMMRATGDMRNDSIVKQEIYEKYIKGQYNVLFVLDDRDRVVQMWRDQGLTCLQVNYGDF